MCHGTGVGGRICSRCFKRRNGRLARFCARAWNVEIPERRDAAARHLYAGQGRHRSRHDPAVARAPAQSRLPGQLASSRVSKVLSASRSKIRGNAGDTLARTKGPDRRTILRGGDPGGQIGDLRSADPAPLARQSSRNARDMLSWIGLTRYSKKVRSSSWIMISAGMPGIGAKARTRPYSSCGKSIWAT